MVDVLNLELYVTLLQNKRTVALTVYPLFNNKRQKSLFLKLHNCDRKDLGCLGEEPNNNHKILFPNCDRIGRVEVKVKFSVEGKQES